MEPLVSFIIPTYNRFDFVKNAIKGARSQTYPNKEVIVVNDRSTDPRYYTHDWKSEGVDRIIHLDKNTRSMFRFPCGGHVRNEGVKASSGEYLAFCDDDDEWLPEKTTRQMAMLASHPECQMSSTNAFHGLGVYTPVNPPKETLGAYNGDQIFEYTHASRINPIICSSVLVSRKAFEAVGGFDRVINGAEDWGLWKKLLKITKCYCIDAPLVHYDANHGHGKNY